MEYATGAGLVVLASGDGDFDLLVTKIKTGYKVQVEVYGIPLVIANSSIKAASKYVQIEK